MIFLTGIKNRLHRAYALACAYLPPVEYNIFISKIIIYNILLRVIFRGQILVAPWLAIVVS